MWNVKECWSNGKTGKNRLCNVIGILSFFLSGARVTDQGLQEIGDFAEKSIEFYKICFKQCLIIFKGYGRVILP